MNAILSRVLARLRTVFRLEPAREAMRDAKGIRLAHDLVQDLRYALRVIRRDPGFAAVAIATLALVIGGNTAIFSVVDAVLLAPLNFPSADRLIVVSEQTPARPEMAVAYPDYLDWLARQSTFESLAASIVVGGVLTGQGDAERVFGRAVSRNFLPTLGVSPSLGRTFSVDEDRPGGVRVVILGYALWQRRYGSDPAIVGRTITYNGDPYTVVGVLPASFDYYGVANANNDFLVPLGPLSDAAYMNDRNSHPVRVIGRLQPDVPIERGRADLSAVAAALAVEHPETNRSVGITTRPLLEDYVGDVRVALSVLLAASLVVLAVACANLANLLLARGAARRREFAVRLALGAGRFRIVRQLLTEGLLLSAVGGAFGVFLGTSAAQAVDGIAPDTLPRVTGVAIDWRVIAFSIGITALAGLAFAVGPALQVSGVDVRRFLGDGGRGSTSAGRRMRDVLVAAQIALCIALLIGAGLLVRSFSALLRVDPGFDPNHVVTMRVRLPDGRYRERIRVLSVLDQTLSRVSLIPGVESACLTTGVPLGRANDERFSIEGEPAPPRERAPVALTQWVSEGFHRTFGIPLLAGRVFTTADREGAADVALVDDEFVRRMFPGSEMGAAVGRRIQLAGEPGRWRQIVGVVRHLRHNGLDEQPRVEVYAPYLQMEPGWQLEIGRAMDLAVRSHDEAQSVVAAVRLQVRAVDPEVPLSHVRTMPEAIRISLAPRVFTLTLLGAFAAIALILCSVGLYGAMSYAVTQRTREIGLRIALGAQPREVLALMMGHAVRLIGAGVVVGIVAAGLGGRLLRDLLYAVQPADAITFAAAAIVLSAIALLATYVPAKRATRLDPLHTLRAD